MFNSFLGFFLLSQESAREGFTPLSKSSIPPFSTLSPSRDRKSSCLSPPSLSPRPSSSSSSLSYLVDPAGDHLLDVPRLLDQELERGSPAE